MNSLIVKYRLREGGTSPNSANDTLLSVAYANCLPISRRSSLAGLLRGESEGWLRIEPQVEYGACGDVFAIK